MVTVVKCPICKNLTNLITKPKYFFKCCGVAHDIKSNVIVEGFKKGKEGDENGEGRSNIKREGNGTKGEGKGIRIVEEGERREGNSEGKGKEGEFIKVV